MVLYLLYESAIGLSLFQLIEVDINSLTAKQVIKQMDDLGQFSQMIRLKAFSPFKQAYDALLNAQNIGIGKLTEDLEDFLDQNLSKKHQLAVQCPKLGQKLSEKDYQVITSETIQELFRGIRTHFIQLIKMEDYNHEMFMQAQLGLGHSFSRNRVEFDVNKQDKPIINCIAIIENLDKDLNQLCMRIKEWFGYHFPELVKIIPDNQAYCQCVYVIGNKNNADESISKLEEIVGEEMAKDIIEAAKISMGSEYSDNDYAMIKQLAKRILKQFVFRNEIMDYLKNRMEAIAPNLTVLAGEIIGAKLIAHTGGISNLVKCPASTIQILGAEKALFQALKTKSKTPKYGLIYNSSYIGRAQTKDKGKISRFFANKLSIASRLDFFLNKPTNSFGINMKEQVETRLDLLSKGKETTHNQDALENVLDELKNEGLYQELKIKKKR